MKGGINQLQMRNAFNYSPGDIVSYNPQQYHNFMQYGLYVQGPPQQTFSSSSISVCGDGEIKISSGGGEYIDLDEPKNQKIAKLFWHRHCKDKEFRKKFNED